MSDRESPFPGASEDFIYIYEALQFVLDHPDPKFYIAVILGAAQDHVIELLKTVFYLIFAGPPNSGKSTAIGATMALTRRGAVLGSASGAYLRDILGGEPPAKQGQLRGTGRAIGISEFGVLLKENSQLLAIVRNGNRRLTSRVGLKIAEGKGWRNETVDVFGFKAMDMHGSFDAHILGRSLVFEMVQSKSLRVALEAESLGKRLERPRETLQRLAAKARQNGWTDERVEQTLHSSEFRRRVQGFKQAYARHGVEVAYLLLINDIFEFGLEDSIRSMMDEQTSELSDDAQMLKEAMIDFAEGKVNGVVVEPNMVRSATEWQVSADLLRIFNETRKHRGLPPKPNVIAELRELGFSTKKQDWVPAKKNMAGPNRGKAIVRPFEKLREWSGDRVASIASIAQRDGRMQPLQPLQPYQETPIDEPTTEATRDRLPPVDPFETSAQTSTQASQREGPVLPTDCGTCCPDWITTPCDCGDCARCQGVAPDEFLT